MKNHSSNRAGKGKTAYRTPHSFIADRPEYLKNKNSHTMKKNSIVKPGKGVSSYPSSSRGPQMGKPNVFKGGPQGKNSQSRRAIPRSK